MKFMNEYYTKGLQAGFKYGEYLQKTSLDDCKKKVVESDGKLQVCF